MSDIVMLMEMDPNLAGCYKVFQFRSVVECVIARPRYRFMGQQTEDNVAHGVRYHKSTSVKNN
jgi:hypothetical protein